MLKIGYVSQFDPFHDRKAWSGTIYKIREGLENAGFEVKWVKVAPSSIKMKLLRLLLKLRYGSSLHHPWIFREMAKNTNWTAANECEILFFPGQAQIMKYSPVSMPYIYYSDACFNQMIDYYWFNINKKLTYLANQEEKWAIQNATLNLRSSQWATDECIKLYKDNPSKNHVLEFGANIDEKDITESSLYVGDQLNLLFSGVDWIRKGGDIAIETVKSLREDYGINAVLTIVGIKSLPDEIRDLDFIVFKGFLNKNDPVQYKEYVNTIRNNHLFLLPTKAECSAIVLCEASAYGLPIYTYDTGGLGNYVLNGVNGYRLAIESTGKEFASRIYKSLKTQEFQNLHEGGLRLYSEKLNWKAWSNRFKGIIETHFKKKV